jgi:hypothetical protein
MNILALWVFLAGIFGLDLEGMGAEIISLSLEQVGGQVLGAITVKPAEGSTKSWGRYAEKRSLGDNVSPTWLSLMNSFVEEVIKEKILKIWVFPVGGRDILQEN